MADDIEIVLAPDCITQIDVDAQQRRLAVDRPRQPGTRHSPENHHRHGLRRGFAQHAKGAIVSDDVATILGQSGILKDTQGEPIVVFESMVYRIVARDCFTCR
jgi:hypothetical protein